MCLGTFLSGHRADELLILTHFMFILIGSSTIEVLLQIFTSAIICRSFFLHLWRVYSWKGFALENIWRGFCHFVFRTYEFNKILFRFGHL